MANNLQDLTNSFMTNFNYNIDHDLTFYKKPVDDATDWNTLKTNSVYKVNSWNGAHAPFSGENTNTGLVITIGDKTNPSYQFATSPQANAYRSVSGDWSVSPNPSKDTFTKINNSLVAVSNSAKANANGIASLSNANATISSNANVSYKANSNAIGNLSNSVNSQSSSASSMSAAIQQTDTGSLANLAGSLNNIKNTINTLDTGSLTSLSNKLAGLSGLNNSIVANSNAEAITSYDLSQASNSAKAADSNNSNGIQSLSTSTSSNNASASNAIQSISNSASANTNNLGNVTNTLVNLFTKLNQMLEQRNR